MNLSRCCRGFVDGKITPTDRESIDQTESLEIWLDGSKKLSRIYREETHKSRWIEISSRFVEKRRKKGSIKGNLSTMGNLSMICQKLSSLKKEGFSKKGKTHRDECNKQATQQRSNQHVKLSKHLSTNIQSIHKSKTHTHAKQV